MSKVSDKLALKAFWVMKPPLLIVSKKYFPDLVSYIFLIFEIMT
jgi:hypothetical protein